MRPQLPLSSQRIATLVLVAFLSAEGFANAQTPIRVAVFEGDGVGKSVDDLLATLAADRFHVCRLTPQQMIDGALADVDVLVHPGGSGSRQGKALSEQGRDAVRDYVSGGGGFLGICAGSYLATNDYTWSLNLVDAKVVDRRHWARGKGTVQLQFSVTGSSFFEVPEQIDLYYGQGPLLARREWDDPKVPNYESLAIYRGEIAKNGAPKGIMPGTSAIVRTRFGSGHVFCFSPHPELTKGRGNMIVKAVDWLAHHTRRLEQGAPNARPPR